MKHPILLIVFLLCTVLLHAQEKKTVEALYITTPLTIDGITDEPVYKSSVPARDFVQLQPYNGQPSYQPSEVHFFYDQTAIYVGAILYDSAPDSIYNFLSQRDNTGMSDYFAVYFDPYNQGQLAFGFFITPAGVQLDMKATKRSGGDSEDSNWDAVWESATQVNEQGWVVEMRIPYSALRFPENAGNVWGVNMFRNIRRYNSNNSWNFIDREVSGFIHQQGQLVGIKDIKPPVRLSFSPYAAAYVEFNEQESSSDFTYKGGMDLKYGISESFTLDMMLIPDFGQIQSDDQRLNLSPYELYYSEKRQFFTEGTELFDRASILYSRRIGSGPKFSYIAYDTLQENEVVDYNPTETQLLNATKISGRTPKGWGLGFLNAMTLPSYATLKDTVTGDTRNVKVQPFSNYNVTVIDKSLPNNSYVGVINSSVLMANNPFMANVSAVDFQIRNKSKTYAVGGKAGVSVRGDEDKETGYYVNLEVKKNSGQLQYGVSQTVNSDKFNINDLGYMRRNNEAISGAWISYQVTDPFFIFREVYTNLWFNHMRTYNPNTLYANQTGMYGGGLFKNNYYLEFNLNVTGHRYDYYEPRVENRYFHEYPSINYNIWARTDSRKPAYIAAYYGSYRQPETEENSYWIGSNLNVRIGKRLQMYYGIEIDNNYNDRGYVSNTANCDTVYFARRNVKTIENVMGTSFILNNKAGLNLRLRHYWSGNNNKDFYQLQEDGNLVSDTDYDGNHDANYNAFNIDFTFRWIFAPGSELTVAWKNSILDYEVEVVGKYFENLGNTWKANQINSFSVKILYYLDYNRLRRKNRTN